MFALPSSSQALFTSDVEIETETHLAIEAFLSTLYPTLTQQPTGIATTIVDQCLELLKEPEKSKAKPATRILAAAFKSSRECRAFLLRQDDPDPTSFLPTSLCRSLHVRAGVADAV